ncbi:MAG TPA: YciI family protein, partial [Dongiaceae bacterium]|nr:YciI family protein [Dongiaceae bacterium]
YTEALKKAGALASANRLQDTETAATVRMVDGKSQVLNGPDAESKEQLGGYYLIDVPDMDSALSWATRCPGANYGTVEVRPVWAMQ